MHPREITISDGGNELLIEWADGSISRISGRRLRNACGCSRCLADRRSGRSGRIPLSLVQEGAAHILSVDLPSSSRLSVAWGDRHETSLYRFSDLIELFPPERMGKG